MAWKRTSFQNYCNSIVGYDWVWYGRVRQVVEDHEDQQAGYCVTGHGMASMVGMVEYERVWRTMRTSTSRQGHCPVASFTRAGYLQLRQAPSTKHGTNSNQGWPHDPQQPQSSSLMDRGDFPCSCQVLRSDRNVILSVPRSQSEPVIVWRIQLRYLFSKWGSNTLEPQGGCK